MARVTAFVAALLLAAFGAAQTAQAQPIEHLPAIAGDYFPLQSRSTGTTYHVYVRYPQGYGNAPARRYPVVYLLDGDTLFPLLAAQHLFLTIDDGLPEAVIVGVAYGSFDPKVNRRDRDFGPGSEAFHAFISDELIPRVEATGRVDPERRILVGQSFGGAFVLYSALSRPDLFWTRIASNPSFRLHGARLWENASPAERDGLRLFIVSGTENPAEPRQQALDWAAKWDGRSPPWKVETIHLEGGTHAADIGNAYRASLRRLFDWSPSPPAESH